MDEKFINIALNLAKKNLGLTAPNPVVGCVIVKDGVIIATGVTAPSGRPHAENIAINKVKDKSHLEGATLYVTLEPCCHLGATGACTDLIIASKIKKVVIACQDPDKRVNGGGIAKLCQASIDVACGIIENEAREFNKAFFKRQKTGLPYVTLKLATSLDGRIATKTGDSKWITGEKSRRYAHYLRAQNDAIIIGANTLRQDNPMLDCRISGLEEYSPTRIIVANNLDFDCEMQIFQTAHKIKTIILTNKINASAQEEKINELKKLAVEFIFCEENVAKHYDKNNKIDLRLALHKIAESGINSVLVEGGKNLATQFLQKDLVDELIWINGNQIIGEDGLSALGNIGVEKIGDALQWVANGDSDGCAKSYRKLS